MASNYSIGDKKLPRSVSDEIFFEDEIETETFVDSPNAITENVSDMLSIEEIVTCAIHLGIMENPRKLQCQHAFCTDCLIKLLQISGTILCPICRAETRCKDLMSLPQALVEKQLIDVIMEKRIAQYSLKPTHEVNMSKEDKEELVKHLLAELKETSSGIYRFDDLQETSDNSKNTVNEPRVSVISPVSSTCSSTYDMMDIETIRENMLKYSSYKEVKGNGIQKLSKINPLRRYCTTQPDFSTFDVHLIKDKTETYEIIFVDSVSNKFFVYSDIECRHFFVRLEEIMLKPVYIRIINDDLFVTGVLNGNGQTFSIFLQCNLYGKIIRKTERMHTHDPGSILPMISGFDVDKRTERYFLCMPQSNSIRVYNTSMIECRQSFEFDNNHPEFVTFQQSQNHIWVSCPQERRILIADADSGTFMMFGTEQINLAIPKMICCTDDDRVLFLDSQSNRFVWINRRGDYILIQRLHFRSMGADLAIQAFQVMPCSLVIIGTSSEFLVFEPVKAKSKLRGNHSHCTLL